MRETLVCIRKTATRHKMMMTKQMLMCDVDVERTSFRLVFAPDFQVSTTLGAGGCDGEG